MASPSVLGKKRVSLLGTGVHAVNLEETLSFMQAQLAERRKGFICLVPAHNLMAARADAGLRDVFNSSLLTVPDGMGTVWFLRLLGHEAGRVYGPDLMLEACGSGQPPDWRHFFLGGAPGVAEKLIERLQAEFPQLLVAGSYAPPFGEITGQENDEIVKRINEAAPDIVWVGLGSPKQERWMAEFRPRLQASLLIGVGAAFDFLSGAKAQAPVWMQRAGLEWLFRLGSEPRRLWRRYAAYPLFIVLALAQIVGITRYPLEDNK